MSNSLTDLDLAGGAAALSCLLHVERKASEVRLGGVLRRGRFVHSDTSKSTRLLASATHACHSQRTGNKKSGLVDHRIYRTAIMPTRAGQRCTRQPHRLHGTTSLRHESRIESSEANSSHIIEDQDEDESEPGTAQPLFIGPRHDGSTPVIEDTPDSEASVARSTPCPGTHNDTPLPELRDQINIDMPDVSQHGHFEDIDCEENDQVNMRTPGSGSMQRLQQVTWRGSNASSVVERQAPHNTTVDNHRARLQASELEVEAGREQLAEMERARTQLTARMKTLEGGLAEDHFRTDALLLFLVVVVVLLMYACFCWANWPEMSYIRRRREEVLRT